MAAEAIAKKRGRPKKAAAAIPVSEIALEKVKSRSRTKVEVPSTDDTSTKSTKAPRKTAQIKTVVVSTKSSDTISIADLTISSPPKPRKQPSNKSPILETATAFTNLRQVSGTLPLSHESSEHDSISRISSLAFTPDTQGPLHPSRPNLFHSNTPTTLSDNVPEPPPSTTVSDSSSSFLSDFLSDRPDPIPHTLDDAKISDRAAFTKQDLVIEDIVSGAGISDISSFQILQSDPGPWVPPRESAIPIVAPKTFKSHRLGSFPDKPQEKSRQPSKPPHRQVEPTNYTIGTFSSFRGTSALSAPATSASPAVSSTTLNLSSSPIQPVTQTSTSTLPTTKAAQEIPSSNSNIKSIHTRSTAPSASAAPSSSPKSNPAPSAQVTGTPTASPSSQPPPNPHPQTRPNPLPLPQFPTASKRPTQMTATELRRDPRFKSMSRNYTRLLVAVPFAIVTTYLLYQRLDEFDREQSVLGALGLGGDGSAEPKRERGVVKVSGRELRDGKSEQGVGES